MLSIIFNNGWYFKYDIFFASFVLIDLTKPQRKDSSIHPSVRITEQKKTMHGFGLVWLFFFLRGEMINGTSIGIKVCKKNIPTYREPFVILWFKARSGECRKRRLINVNIIHCNWTIWSNAHSVVHIDPKYFKPIRTTHTHT